VIAEPPLAGAVQVITKLVPEIEVVGLPGAEGTPTSGIVADPPSADSGEAPAEFAA